MFATGIENSYPNILLRDGTIKRVDEMEKTDHYNQWGISLKSCINVFIASLISTFFFKTFFLSFF